MLDSVFPIDEDGRLQALSRTGLADESNDHLFEPVVTLIQSVYEAPIAFVSTIEAKRQRYKCSIGLEIGELERDISLCNHVVASGEVMVIEDAVTDPRFQDHPLVAGPMRIRSYLGAPLRTVDGYSVGSVCMVDRVARHIGEREVAIMRQFADLVLEQSELLQIAERDALTGAWTRRAFLQAAAKEMARARRHGEKASIALFDLDRFKLINDTFGHRTGDGVLQSAVAACEARMRVEETLGRLGGEEFAVLLVGTDRDSAVGAAERLRKGIEAARYLPAPHVHFTASFGVAELADGMERPEDWVEAADRALYRAKEEGRNRTEAA